MPPNKSNRERALECEVADAKAECAEVSHLLERACQLLKCAGFTMEGSATSQMMHTLRNSMMHPEDKDDLAFNSQRLRNVAKLAGLSESEIPQSELHLDQSRGAVLGQIARKMRDRDAEELRNMLRSLQNCEMSVSRARELIDMWLAGNYNDSMLPEAEPEADAVKQIARLDNIAAMIHYPACWDSAVYPTLEDAIHECVDFSCNNCAAKT